MTHLAINSLAAMAARGFKVVGFDTDSTRTGPLQRGELPFAEPDLPEYFAANAARITFSSDSSVLGDCDIVYVAPDRSEEHTSELQSLMRNSYAVFCLKKKKIKTNGAITTE